MELNPECGICGANLTDFEGNPIHSFDCRFPDAFSDIFLVLRKLPRLLYGQNWCYNYTGAPMEVAYITGADLFIRKNLFTAIKGFDPFFFMYYEETELSIRIKKMNYTIYSIPDAVIAHKKGASLRYNAGINEAFYQSKYYYIKKTLGIYHAYIAHIVFFTVCCLKTLSLRLGNKIELYQRYRDIISIEHSVFCNLNNLFLENQVNKKR
jgi:GT2 family glycosyltransferase